MKNKLIIIIVSLAVIASIISSLVIKSNEDNWIKDSNGVYIKHGNPSTIPEPVKQQQELISCANKLYNEAKQNLINFSSQCLGRCDDYSIDIAHNPRTDEDNFLENQCQDFRKRITHHFIELDKDGNIIRIM